MRIKHTDFLSHIHTHTHCQSSAISAVHKAFLRLSLKAESRNCLLPISDTCLNSQSAEHSQLQHSLDYAKTVPWLQWKNVFTEITQGTFQILDRALQQCALYRVFSQLWCKILGFQVIRTVFAQSYLSTANNRKLINSALHKVWLKDILFKTFEAYCKKTTYCKWTKLHLFSL